MNILLLSSKFSSKGDNDWNKTKEIIRRIKDLNHFKKNIRSDTRKMPSNIKLVPEEDNIAVKKIVINTTKLLYLNLFKE